MEKLTKENWEVLNSLELESLEDIYNDSVLAVDSQLETENIINEKSSHLFNLVVAICISTIGYWISNIESASIKNLFFQISCISMIPLCACIIMLYNIIYPSVSYSKGFTPSVMAQKDIFTNIGTDRKRHFMNKISSINRGIHLNGINNKRKSRLLKLSVKTLLYTILFIVIYSIAYYLLNKYWR